MKAFAIFLIIAVALLPLLASPVRGLERTILWDTRAEFDSGLKSNVTGHIGLETYTDNPAWKRPGSPPEEGLYASSIYGDNFRLPDTDAETWKLERPAISFNNSQISYAGAVASPNAWTNPANAVGSGETTCAESDPNLGPHGEWDTYGFSFASSTTIQGINIRIKYSSIAVSETWFVRLLKAGIPTGNTASTPGASGAACGVSQGTILFGTPTELWGTTWSAAEVSASTFGVEVWTSGPPDTVFLNWIQVTIFFLICNDNGSEWITTADPTFSYTSPSSGLNVMEILDTADGAMVYMHNGTLRNSTRTTTAWTSGGNYWRMGTDIQPSMWGIGNFTWVMNSLSPGDSTTRIYCGGLETTSNTASWGAGFYLRKTVITDLGPWLFSLQPFLIQAGNPVDCGSRTFWGAGNTIRPRIERSGTSFSFQLVSTPEVDVGPNPLPTFLGTCLLNSTFQGQFMYETFDFNSSSGIGGAVLIHAYKEMTQGLFSSPEIVFAGGSSSDANWTSPSTAGPATERPTRFRITVSKDTLGGLTICTPSLVAVNDWTLIYQPAQWNLCTIPTYFDTRAFIDFTVQDAIADGPYRFRIFMIGDTHYWNRIDSIEVSLQFEPLIVPCPPGECEGEPPPAILAPITGGIVFCGVGVAVFIVFIILVRRVRDG